MPHLLFYGPPGTGKTSTIHALAKDLFGPEFYKQRVLELNASDERGIQVVREKIKNFAKLVANQQVPGFPCPNFKLIILDEADSMTNDAQSALRRIMETYSQVTRFCIICNYVSKIIDPVTSRCAKFRFKLLPEQNVVQKLQAICEAEGISSAFGEQALRKVNGISGGDMRRSIMFLQGASKLVASESSLDAEELIDEISGRIPAATVSTFWDKCLQEEDLDVVLAWLSEQIIRLGYSANQFLEQALDELVTLREEFDAKAKALLSQKIALTEERLTCGADEFLQLMDFGASCWKVCHQ